MQSNLEIGKIFVELIIIDIFLDCEILDCSGFFIYMIFIIE